MKLFVDDLRACPDGWTLARTVSAAIERLARGVVDEISLDFDIECHHVTCGDRRKFVRGFHPYKICAAEDFGAVAHYVALMSHRPAVRIHTGNPVGGAKMAAILEMEYDNEIFNPKNYESTLGESK